MLIANTHTHTHPHLQHIKESGMRTHIIKSTHCCTMFICQTAVYNFMINIKCVCAMPKPIHEYEWINNERQQTENSDQFTDLTMPDWRTVNPEDDDGHPHGWTSSASMMDFTSSHVVFLLSPKRKHQPLLIASPSFKFWPPWKNNFIWNTTVSPQKNDREPEFDASSGFKFCFLSPKNKASTITDWSS